MRGDGWERADLIVLLCYRCLFAIISCFAHPGTPGRELNLP